ncbi:MAG: DUF3892 domain-containing protein [Anaerolineaceae bacterium]|nr:DUF3892 domain-containing protein [Anaerolineaceae bacterium]
MGEKADFYIEKVRYSKDRKRILRVSVREDSGTKLTKAFDMDRDKVIGLILEGKQFMTIFRNDTGKYRKGQLVVMSEVNGRSFIRTDEHQVKTDQLDRIPEY